MLTVLVTGSYGQLGNEIKDIAHQFPGFSFLFHDVDTLDITDFETLSIFFQQHPVHYIINCASYTQVDQAEKDPETAYLINATGPEYLAKLANSHSSRMIHISTDYVFDGTKGSPYREEDIPNPLSVYGKSKFAGEKHVLQYADNMVIRTSWLYSSHGSNFVKKINDLSHQKKSISVVDDQVGSPTYAHDLAHSILTIISSISAGTHSWQPGIYHCSNEGSCSWFELALEIVKGNRSRCEVVPVKTLEYPLPAPRPAYSTLNKEKIKSQYRIRIPEWQESLSVCMQKIQKK
jgi:dTDP-4-dehydrorhamnose reductase